MKTYSTENQDRFVLTTLKELKGGFFIDIGCRHPIEGNNTYLLETEYDWTGVLIDLDVAAINLCKHIRKKSKSFAMDVIEKPLSRFILPNCPQTIDYVSFDVDEANLSVIRDWDFDKYKIKCLTFEHDAYSRGESLRIPSREIFEKNGYKLVCSDVSNILGQRFEDWYCSDLVPPDYYKDIICEGKIHTQIFN